MAGQPAAFDWIPGALRDAFQAGMLGIAPSVRLAGRDQLPEGTLAPDEAGVAIHPDGSAQAVDTDTFAILGNLRHPRALDLGDEPPDSLRGLARLVAMGLVEVRTESGAGLYDILPALHEVGADLSSVSVAARLSGEALDHALKWADALPDVQTALYNYGRRPGAVLTPDAFAALLKAADGIAGFKQGKGTGYWHHWRAADLSEVATWKLYVTPHPEDAVDVWRATFALAPQIGAVAYKMPRRPNAFTRSDAVIFYMSGRSIPTAVASRLLPHMPATGRGVPFAFALDDHGRLAWGRDSDDPDAAHHLASFRGLVTFRLAGRIRTLVRTGLPLPRLRARLGWDLCMMGYLGNGTVPLYPEATWP